MSPPTPPPDAITALTGLPAGTVLADLMAAANTAAAVPAPPSPTCSASSARSSGNITPDFSRSFTVYDAQGTSHIVTMGFLKTGTNTWQTELYTDPAGVTAPANGVLGTGTLKFNGDGSLDLANSLGSLFTGGTPQEWAAINPTWSNGADTNAGGIQLALGSDGKLDGLIQSSDQSNLRTQSTDGGMLGAVASVSVASNGIVSAIFEDGTSRPVYRLPLATFSNPDGLKALSGNAYQVSQQSGNALINPASQGSGARGGRPARRLQRGPRQGIHQHDPLPARLQRVLEDHHHGGRHAAGTQQHEALILSRPFPEPLQQGSLSCPSAIFSPPP